MVDDKNDSERQSETLYSKVIPKFNKAGSRQVGSMTVETKVIDGSKFVQLTQHKEAFGSPGSEGFKPAKDSWVTFDPSDKALKDAIAEAVKA